MHHNAGKLLLEKGPYACASIYIKMFIRAFSFAEAAENPSKDIQKFGSTVLHMIHLGYNICIRSST